MHDRLESICFIAGGALLAAHSALGLHGPEPWALSPALFPLLVAVSFIGLGLLLFRRARKEKRNMATAGQAAAPASAANLRLGLICLLTLLYIVLLPVLHFFASTLLYSILFMLLSGERRFAVLALVPLCVTASAHFLFDEIFAIVMP